MENYIVINGKKAELTDEQLEKLGVETKKNPFSRVKKGETYYYPETNIDGEVIDQKEADDLVDNYFYKTAQYCTDEKIARQLVLDHILNCLLTRWVYENDPDALELDYDSSLKFRYFIHYNFEAGTFKVSSWDADKKSKCIHFSTYQKTEQAINEIVEPFMEEHPEYVW